MPVETAADRAAMFSLSDWAVKARYRSRGRNYDLIGIFDSAYVGVDVAEAEFASTLPVFTVQTASLACQISLGDALIVDGTGYIVRNFQHDGTGVTVLRLEIDLDLDFAEEANLETEAGDNLITEANMYLLQEAA
jgi:hypothetical protein